MQSVFLYVYNRCFRDMFDFDSLRRILTGWFIFCCTRFLPRSKYSEFAGEPHGAIIVLPESIRVLSAAISILSATVGGHSRPNFTATRVNHSSGLRPLHSPADFYSTPRPTLLHHISRPTSFHPTHPPTPYVQTIIF